MAEDKDGLLTISEYRQPSEGLTFFDLGIDEDMLFEKVKKIENHANFRSSKVTGLGDLESIGRDADFKNSQEINLSNLEQIRGSAYFTNSNIVSLPKLITVWGHANFQNSKITDIPNLERVGGNAFFQKSQLNKENKLQFVRLKIYVKEYIGAIDDVRELNEKLAEGYFD